MDALSLLLQRSRGRIYDDWLDESLVPVEEFRRLTELRFAPGEIVIAVGSFVAEEVMSLDRDVVKVRYCHGFQDGHEEFMARAWGGPVPTLAVSALLIPRLKAYGCQASVAVVPNGIRPEQYFPDATDREGVGTVFGSHPAKDPETIIDVMARIGERRPSVPRFVFGPEPPPRELKPFYWRYPSVEVTRRLYSKSLVWLVCSRSEGFCLPILEAMACGCAVVSTDHAGARSLITAGHNGLVVPTGDANALLASTELLLDNAVKREELVRNGFETVRQYSWEAAAVAMEVALTKICGGAATSGHGRGCGSME